MSQDVLSALDAIHTQIRKRLLQNPEYRAMLSIERTIAEVAELMSGNFDRRSDPQQRRESRETVISDAYSAAMSDQIQSPGVSSVLESIAAKAVSSVAARNSLATSAAPTRAAQGGR